MKLPWTKPPKVRELEQEAEQMRHAIEATQPIVEEAVRRTNDSYIAVERETRQARSLISDLKKGWNGDGRC